jgi:hypothetical protein
VPVVDGGGALVFRWWCRWQRLNLGGGRRVSVGEGKMEEIDGSGFFFSFFERLFLFFEGIGNFSPLHLFKKI